MLGIEGLAGALGKTARIIKAGIELISGPRLVFTQLDSRDVASVEEEPVGFNEKWYLVAEVENKGNAGAENCTVKFDFEGRSDDTVVKFDAEAQLPWLNHETGSATINADDDEPAIIALIQRVDDEENPRQSFDKYNFLDVNSNGSHTVRRALELPEPLKDDDNRYSFPIPFDSITENQLEEFEEIDARIRVTAANATSTERKLTLDEYNNFRLKERSSRLPFK